MEGFRYAKAAAGYLLEHYSESVAASEKQNIQETYRELSEKWGIEMEFEAPELNKEMGFDDFYGFTDILAELESENALTNPRKLYEPTCC